MQQPPTRVAILIIHRAARCTDLESLRREQAGEFGAVATARVGEQQLARRAAMAPDHVKKGKKGVRVKKGSENISV